MWLVREGMTPEGVKLYEDWPRVRSHIFEKRQTKEPLSPEEENHILWKLEQKSVMRGTTGRKINTRDFPALTALPTFEQEKESKMYLCYEPVPGEDKVNLLKEKVSKFIDRWGPKILPDINDLNAISFGDQLYYDNGQIKHDRERPSKWNSRFKYQWFWTSPVSKREVWLPSKGYKTWSTYWHQMSSDIVRNCPFTISNDTVTEIRKSLYQKDPGKMRKIDLKGFGLQYPRNYILAIIDVIITKYGMDKDQLRKLESYFDIELENEDGTIQKPHRGVGLGYFTNIMVIGIASILQDFDVKKMFSDDILISDSDFKEAVRALESFGFIINQEKTGELWHKAAYFAGTTMTKAGSLRHWDAQAHLASAFGQRHHSTRKDILSSLNLSNRFGVLFTYKNTFGWEYHPEEIFKHPDKLGANPQALDIWGYEEGTLLRTVKGRDRTGESVNGFPKMLALPWKEERLDSYDEEKRVELAKKLSKVKYDNTYDLLEKPRIQEMSYYRSSLDLFLGAYQLPAWADLAMLESEGMTSGRTTQGLLRDTAVNSIFKYPLARNPFQVCRLGGYTQDYNIALDKLPREEFQKIYYLIRDCRYYDNNFLWKEEVEKRPPDKVVSVKLSEDLRPAEIGELSLKITLPENIDSVNREDEESQSGSHFDPTELLSLEEMENGVLYEDNNDW